MYRELGLCHLSVSLVLFCLCVYFVWLLRLPRPSVVIGSHSGQLVRVDAQSGVELWRTTLPGRIEGSAALSMCGCCVLIGRRLTTAVFSYWSV